MIIALFRRSCRFWLGVVWLSYIARLFFLRVVFAFFVGSWRVCIALFVIGRWPGCGFVLFGAIGRFIDAFSVFNGASRGAIQFSLWLVFGIGAPWTLEDTLWGRLRRGSGGVDACGGAARRRHLLGVLRRLVGIGGGLGRFGFALGRLALPFSGAIGGVSMRGRVAGVAPLGLVFGGDVPLAGDPVPAAGGRVPVPVTVNPSVVGGGRRRWNLCAGLRGLLGHQARLAILVVMVVHGACGGRQGHGAGDEKNGVFHGNLPGAQGVGLPRPLFATLS